MSALTKKRAAAFARQYAETDLGRNVTIKGVLLRSRIGNPDEALVLVHPRDARMERADDFALRIVLLPATGTLIVTDECDALDYFRNGGTR